MSKEKAHAGEAAGEPFPYEHKRGLLPDKFFRWRAGEISRLEAFCDVVFGFALTLLVVSLEVPKNYEELMAAMRGFVPFAVCFAQLIMIWRAHYVFSRRYGLEDGYSVFLNVLLLFVALFYVYPLKFVFTFLFMQVMRMPGANALSNQEAAVVMRVYAAGFMAVFLIFGLMYAHAYRLRRLLKLNAAEEQETRNAVQENALMVAIGMASFAITFYRADFAGWIYVLIGPVLSVHGAAFGRKVRLLAGK